MSKLWSATGGPKSQAHVAGAVGMAESMGDPNAFNPSGASGLWQILGQVVPGDIFNPRVNAENAIKKYNDANGWSPWEAYTNGAYQQYMAGAGSSRSSPAAGSFATSSTPGARPRAARAISARR